MAQNKWLAALTIVAMSGLGQSALAEAVTSNTHDTHRSDAQHSQHSAHGSSALKLNAGKKWETDAPLRAAMANIQQAMAAALTDIHNDTLPISTYDSLAATTQQGVANIVSQCKLKPEADAQLHLVIAELLQGTEAMKGNTTGISRRQGAIKVMGALKNYAAFFEDDTPLWRSESH